MHIKGTFVAERNIEEIEALDEIDLSKEIKEHEGAKSTPPYLPSKMRSL